MVDRDIIDIYANILIRKALALSLEESYVMLIVMYAGFEIHIYLEFLNIFLIYYRILG